MIDFSHLAKKAVNIIGTALATGGNEIIKRIASDLWTNVKSLLNKKGHEKLIGAFEKNPTDLSTKEQIVIVLENELRQDENMAQNISKLIHAIKTSDGYQNFVSQIGDKNIAVTGKINNSTITINK